MPPEDSKHILMEVLLHFICDIKEFVLVENDSEVGGGQ